MADRSDMIEDNYPEVFAYKRIDKDFSEQTQKLHESFDALMSVARKLESPLIADMKMHIALTLKWRFDYLAKTGESPFLLRRDTDYWINFLNTLGDLLNHNWFNKEILNLGDNAWDRTRKAFNYMWPRNTGAEQFNISRKMVLLRLEQILSMTPQNGKWLEGRSILDVGCGPARYITCLLKYNPKTVIGIDFGADIIENNKQRFAEIPYVDFVIGSADKIPFKDDFFDFVTSVGVIHHLPTPIRTSIREHARITAPGGYLFVFIAGSGGLELKVWEFLRNFLYDISIEDMFRRFNGKISPLRLQGLLDTCYGEYQQTSREECERWLLENFRQIKRVPGIPGLDITPEIYKNDPYFEARFGSGNLRYLCQK